jgi:hypothetical protein
MECHERNVEHLRVCRASVFPAEMVGSRIRSLADAS